MAWQPRTPGPRSQVVRLVAVTSVWALYYWFMFLSHERWELSLGPLAIIPVVATGLLLGFRGGLTFALVAIPLSIAIRLTWATEGVVEIMEESAVGWIVGIAVGTGAGWGAETVQSQRRQALHLQEVRDTLDHAGDAIFFIDPATGRFLDCNLKASTDSGYTRDQLLLMSVPDLDPSVPGPEAWAALMRQVKQQGGSITFPGSLRRKDGAQFPIEVNSRLVASAGREVLVAVVRDITERQAVLEQLQERDRLLGETQQVGHIGSWAIDLVTGKQSSTEENRRLFDLQPGEAETQENIVRHMHPDDRSLAIDGLKSIVSTGSGRFDHRIILQDGTLRWLHTEAALRCSPDGTPARIVGITQDITQRRAQDELLQQGRALLLETQAVAKVGSWEIDLASGRHQGSPENSRLYGVAHADVQDRSEITKRIHPDDLVRTMHALENTLKNGHDDIEQRIIQPDGSIRWLHVTGELRRNAAGLPARIVGISQDITERKMAELEILAAQERFLLAAKATRDIIWEWDPRTNESYHNDQILALGWSREELVTIEAFAEKVHPDDMTQFGTLGAVVAPGGPNHLELEYRFRRKDGTYAHFLDRAEILRDAGGNAVKFVGAMSDVTASRAASTHLREAEGRLRALLDNLDEVFISQDLTKGTGMISKSAIKLFGRPAEDFEKDQTLWSRMIHPDDRAAVLASYGRLMAGQPTHDDARVVRPDGSVRWMHAAMHPQLDAEGKLVAIYGMLRDTTAEREAEERRLKVQELEEVTAFKTRFLNNAAHELATPLTPIRLQMATMRQLLVPQLDETQRKAVDLLDRNLDRLALLVNDLLDAARLQSGKLRVGSAQIDASRVVSDVEASLRRTLADKGLSLTVERPSGFVPLLGDEARLHQVLFNLVHNASKFTPKGGTVMLRLTQEKLWTTLAVEDSGIGLEADQIARLFQPFSQVHDTAVLKAGGTGLGLYISKSIVEQLGGTIVCRSAGRDKGTTFEVRFPSSQAPPAAA